MAGYSKNTISKIVVNNAVQAEYANNALNATNATRAVSASYALTASYAMNGGGSGGVTQILAGTNITLTPSEGTGIVTINSTASGSSSSGSSFPYTGSAVITGSLIVTGSTVSTNGFTGSLFGTSSWATSVSTASYAPNYVLNSATSSFITNSQTSSFTTNSQTSSFTTTSSFNSFTGSYNTGSFTGSFTGSLFGTSSWTTNALTASYVLNAISSSYAATTSLAPNYVLTSVTSSMLASYVLNSATSSFVTNSQTSSFVQNSQTSSFVTNSQTSSFVTNSQTSSFVTNSQTSSFTTTSSFNSFTSSINTVTSSFVTNSQTSSFVQNSQTSSMTVATASYITGSIFSNGNIVRSASYAVTASYAMNGGTPISTLVQSISSNSWTFNHNLGITNPIVTIYDSTNKVIIPQEISSSNTNTLIISFPISLTGTAVAAGGAYSGTTPTNAVTASYTLLSVSASYASSVNSTFSGNQTLSGSIILASPTSPAFNGEIVQFGAGTLTTGQLYFLSSSGTWSLSNANSTGSSVGMLGIAVGSSPTTNGLLVRGLAASSSYLYGTGSVVYMATGSGIMTATSPSSSNHVVRVVGYQTSLSNTIYFNPDPTWITLA